MAGENQNQGGDAAAAAAAAVAGQNQGGQTGKEYLQYFPEAIRGEKTLEKFSGKDANEVLGKVATSYINLEKHAGGAIKVPGENATKEEWAAFHTKLGVPEKPEGYGLTFKDAKIPEGVAIDEAGFTGFLSWARENGFTKGQVTKMVDRFVQSEQARVDSAAQDGARTAETAYAEVKKEWGSLTDRNVALVQRGVKEFGGEEFATMLNKSGLGNDPRFLKFAFKVFQPMMEDGLIKGENLGMRTGDAQAEIKKLMASEEYQGKKGRAEQVAAVEKIRELTAIAHADAA